MLYQSPYSILSFNNVAAPFLLLERIFKVLLGSYGLAALVEESEREIPDYPQE